MNELTDKYRKGLDVAFNEATLLGVEVVPSRNVCGITLALCTLPAIGPPPAETRIQLLLYPVGRITASLRLGRWDDDDAPVQRFELPELLDVVQQFGGLPIYGWEFLDLDDSWFEHWSNRLSLDWQGNPSGMKHSLRLFQEGSNPERHLDLRVWFGQFEFRKPDGSIVPVEDVIAGGKRWWDGLFKGDKRTRDRGIFPAE